MKRVQTCMGSLLVLALLAPILGAAQEIPKTIYSVNWAENRESRRAHAVEWLTEVASIEKQIPTLSPAEEAWLTVEYDEEIKREGMTPRAIRAMGSKEYAARSAKPVAQSMVAVLRLLASPSTLDEPNEVYLWTRLAYLVLDINFWRNIATLGQHGIVARSPQTPQSMLKTTVDFQMVLFETWAIRVKDILGRIILPHVRQ